MLRAWRNESVGKMHTTYDPWSTLFLKQFAVNCSMPNRVIALVDLRIQHGVTADVSSRLCYLPVERIKF